MPEGPTILLVRETLAPIFDGKKLISASGSADIQMDLLRNIKLDRIRTWGKQLLLCFPGITVRIHFLMFGTYSINKKIRADRTIRLALCFPKKTLYFYTSSVKMVEQAADSVYDWEVDVLNKKWNGTKARRKLKKIPETLACDALLDQDIFSGVGNIIKNEVLFRIRLHPETPIRHIPPRKLTELVKEASNYTHDFLKWKKASTLKQHWLAYSKKKCPRCNLPMTKKPCGKAKRTTFFCENCQILY